MKPPKIYCQACAKFDCLCIFPALDEKSAIVRLESFVNNARLQLARASNRETLEKSIKGWEKRLESFKA